MILKITQNEINEEIRKGIETPNRFAIVEYTDLQVNYGFDEKPNFEYCKQNNIPCVDIGRRGGAFVINKGDIGFGCVVRGLDNTIGYLITNKFVEYLVEKGLNAIYDSNDILIDDYKVYGWSSHFYRDNNALFISCHFTMSVDLDLIEKICTKPMSKIPKGLKDYGITKEQILDFISSFEKEML